MDAATTPLDAFLKVMKVRDGDTAHGRGREVEVHYVGQSGNERLEADFCCGLSERWHYRNERSPRFSELVYLRGLRAPINLLLSRPFNRFSKVPSSG